MVIGTWFCPFLSSKNICDIAPICGKRKEKDGGKRREKGGGLFFYKEYEKY